MPKNKKGKVIQLKSAQFSPEKYIKTQARSLPVAECLISEEWESTGICNIIIAREHKNGNITAGIYLVDMYCLGLKDAHCEFNLYPDEYEHFKYAHTEWEKCEYALAHNIIYGAIAFAEDYGFKPHKDFSVAQFILEEDDEHVEFMEIDFGLDGMPCFIPGPNDDEAKIKNITNTLMRTAGDGNFKVYESADFADMNDEDWDDEEDDLPEESEKTLLGIFLNGVKKINLSYETLIRTPEAKKILQKSRIGKDYQLCEDSVENEHNKFDNAEQERDYNRLRESLYEKEYKQTIKELQKTIAKYPRRPEFHNLLLSAYVFNDKLDKLNETIFEMYRLFPDYLFAMTHYANVLIDAHEPEHVLGVFKGKPDLNYLYPDRKVFTITEAASYYACMCRYFIAVDNIDSADLYMNALFENDLIEKYGPTLVRGAIMELCKAKTEKIENQKNNSG